MRQFTNRKWEITGIIISWLTFGIIILSLIGLIFWVGILVYLVVKKYSIKWYIISSSWVVVPIFSFILGTFLYFNGNAYIKEGFGGCETYHGIDKETRVVSTSNGRLFIGYEIFVYPANNIAVRFLTSLFGYEDGAYNGIFPSENEAREIIKTAEPVVIKYRDGFIQFELKNQKIKLNTSDFYNYGCLEQYGFGIGTNIKFDKAIGKIINNECFVFQNINNKNDFSTEVTLLVDIKKNRLLKIY